MAYRHLTSDELDALCAEYEVLRNLRDAASRNDMEPSDGDSYFFHATVHAKFDRIVGTVPGDPLGYSAFWIAQRDYHNTARILAGLKPYR